MFIIILIFHLFINDYHLSYPAVDSALKGKNRIYFKFNLNL